MNILITGAFPLNNEYEQKIRELGYNVYFHKDERTLVDSPQIYDAVICNGLFLYNDIKKFKNLKIIQLTSAGYDRIDMDYIKNKNIRIYNARGVYSIPIAEWAVGKILELYKKSRKFYKSQEKHIWEKEREIFELYNKTAFIVGFGSIGTEIAKRLKVFGVKILGVDIFKPDCLYFDEYYNIKELNESLKKSDIVISTVPLTESTFHIFNSEKFDSMKPYSIFCNFSRGKVTDQSALIRALKEKRIYGAILDVFEEEPLSENSELWNFENVIITPHNSFIGEGNNERMFGVIYKNLKEWK